MNNNYNNWISSDQLNKNVLAIACKYSSVHYTLNSITPDGVAKLTPTEKGTTIGITKTENYETMGVHLPEYPDDATLDNYNVFIKQLEHDQY